MVFDLSWMFIDLKVIANQNWVLKEDNFLVQYKSSIFSVFIQIHNFVLKMFSKKLSSSALNCQLHNSLCHLLNFHVWNLLKTACFIDLFHDCLLIIYMSILFFMWKTTEKKTATEGSDGKFNDFKLITSWWFCFVDASLVHNINADTQTRKKNVFWVSLEKTFFDRIELLLVFV